MRKILLVGLAVLSTIVQADPNFFTCKQRQVPKPTAKPKDVCATGSELIDGKCYHACKSGWSASGT